MRILIVTQYFWPESFNINGLATDLKNRGHEVEVLTGLPNYPVGAISKGYSLFSGPWTEDYMGVKIHRTALLPRGKGFLRLAINYISFVFVGSFKALFMKNKYDVIFCFSLSPITSCLPAILIRWLHSKPLAIWIQDLWPESVSAVGATESNFVINSIGKLVKFIYKNCDMILIQSQAFRQSVLRWGGLESRMHFIPNWAEPFPDSTQTPEWVKSLPSGFKIGFAGNVGRAQDLRTLILAAEHLKDYKDIKWIIVGDGSEKAWLDSEIASRNLSETVITLGRKPYADMLPFFSVCDALYVSLSKEHIFSLTVPSKVQAYMSVGRPIIASLDGEGARVIQESAAGISVPASDSKRLAETVLSLKTSDLDLRLKMGANARKYYVKNFEKGKVISQIEELLSGLVSQK